MGKKIDIILPTHDNSEFTIPCLESIRRHAGECRIIWIDNGSDLYHYQQVSDYLDERFDDYLEFSTPERLGFVKAVNIGLAAATAPLIVIQNNDTVIFERTYDILRFAMENGADLAGPASSSGWQSYRNLPLPGKSTPRDPQTAEALWQRFGQAMHPVLPPVMLAFFCVMIRREAAQKIGYLSEEFGEGFGDDDDYCYRAHAAGFKLFFCPGAYCWHNHRTTFRYVHGSAWQQMQEKNINLIREKYPVHPVK